MALKLNVLYLCRYMKPRSSFLPRYRHEISRSNFCSQSGVDKIQTKDGEDTRKRTPEMKLVYTSEYYHSVMVGKMATLFWGACCVAISPFLLLYPLEESSAFLSSAPMRCILSGTMLAVGVTVPRWFALVSSNIVTEMHYCETTNTVQLATVSPWLREKSHQVQITDLVPITDEPKVNNLCNVVCKKTGMQFFVDTKFIDDDMLQLMGFMQLEEDDIHI